MMFDELLFDGNEKCVYLVIIDMFTKTRAIRQKLLNGKSVFNFRVRVFPLVSCMVSIIS